MSVCASVRGHRSEQSLSKKGIHYGKRTFRQKDAGGASTLGCFNSLIFSNLICSWFRISLLLAVLVCHNDGRRHMSLLHPCPGLHALLFQNKEADEQESWTSRQTTKLLETDRQTQKKLHSSNLNCKLKQVGLNANTHHHCVKVILRLVDLTWTSEMLDLLVLE